LVDIDVLPDDPSYQVAQINFKEEPSQNKEG
jgi:hypothetical protein